MPPKNALSSWICVTLPDARRCLLPAEPDPEAMLGMRDDILPGYAPVRIVALIDVGSRTTRMTRKVIQMRQGWDAELPPGLAYMVAVLAAHA